ncbi:hypothetical protein COLO4_33139 [Corchorus olitorius]|uniref:Uncharacterized protein n=1 Tax=Corchorus olitorius TaxID=93759 RepID=A0A1R3GW33_9ROSI|nr:hypothetical protein COLO4_33139 [Corchorus olitorius]
MALAASSVIGGVSHNRTINSLSFQLPKHGNIACSNCRIFTASCLAKTAASDVELPNSNPTTAAADSWSEFARNVSGEWDGFGADFSIEGSPIELPESVVPEAYREWEVKVYDWQTQCPTLAQPGENVMTYKNIKLLPTVGCEADAATRYSIDERNIGGVDNKVSAFAYQSSGCYTAVWPVADSGTHEVWELEHCLINPRDKESRVRIIQVVCVNGTKFVLQNIRVFCEQWYGPFRNGDQLGGCAIRDSAFASTAATKASDVVGVWQGQKAVANFYGSGNNLFQELKSNGALKSIRDESNLILLPKQLWCSLKERGSETCSEEVSIALETTVLEGV